MKRIRIRRPSPALALAFAALFVSLGGVSYGVATGSIDSREIKDQTITYKDVRPDKLGGGVVKEQGLDVTKLKTVPKADDAARLAGVESRRVDAFSLGIGETRQLLTTGPLTLTAQCRADGANHVAEVIVTSTANASAVDGAQTDADLGPGEEVALSRLTAAAGTPAFDQEAAGAAIASDGTELLGQDLYLGLSVLGQPNVCRFGGTLYLG
jgi:hypothetical protein